MTLRPFGPSVTLTALFRISTPRNMRSRASVENLISLADMVSSSSVLTISWPNRRSGSFRCGHGHLDDAHDVGLLYDEEILAIEPDLVARPFAEQNPVSDFDVERNQLAALVSGTRADGDHFAFL